MKEFKSEKEVSIDACQALSGSEHACVSTHHFLMIIIPIEAEKNPPTSSVTKVRNHSELWPKAFNSVGLSSRRVSPETESSRSKKNAWKTPNTINETPVVISIRARILSNRIFNFIPRIES